MSYYKLKTVILIIIFFFFDSLEYCSFNCVTGVGTNAHCEMLTCYLCISLYNWYIPQDEHSIFMGWVRAFAVLHIKIHMFIHDDIYVHNNMY